MLFRSLQLECEPQGAGAFLSSTWHTRRLKSDGTHEEWQLAAYHQQGPSLVFTPTLGGIYQVRAHAFVAAGGSDERYYVWNADEAADIGLKRKGDRKAFGVCDEEWQLDLLNCAKSYLGSTDYAVSGLVPGLYGYSDAGEGSYKCSYFVAYRIRESGLNLPVQRQRYWRKYPPLANDWSGGAVISGWDFLGTSISPQPGYVIAHPAAVNGHCGIVDFDGNAVAAGLDNVNRRYADWQDGTSGFRRYANEN